MFLLIFALNMKYQELSWHETHEMHNGKKLTLRTCNKTKQKAKINMRIIKEFL